MIQIQYLGRGAGRLTGNLVYDFIRAVGGAPAVDDVVVMIKVLTGFEASGRYVDFLIATVMVVAEVSPLLVTIGSPYVTAAEVFPHEFLDFFVSRHPPSVSPVHRCGVETCSGDVMADMKTFDETVDPDFPSEGVFVVNHLVEKLIVLLVERGLRLHASPGEVVAGILWRFGADVAGGLEQTALQTEVNGLMSRDDIRMLAAFLILRGYRSCRESQGA